MPEEPDRTWQPNRAEAVKRRLDGILHEINSGESLTAMLMTDGVFENEGARETALVRTKLQEARFWAEEAKRKIDQED